MMMFIHHIASDNRFPAGHSGSPSTDPGDADSPQALREGGRPVPETVTWLVGVDPPFVEFRAEFKTTEEAKQAEPDMMVWKGKMLTDLPVILSGSISLFNHLEISQEGNIVRLHTEASTEELQRLLSLLVTLTRTSLAYPR